LQKYGVSGCGLLPRCCECIPCPRTGLCSSSSSSSSTDDVTRHVLPRDEVRNTDSRTASMRRARTLGMGPEQSPSVCGTVAPLFCLAPLALPSHLCAASRYVPGPRSAGWYIAGSGCRAAEIVLPSEGWAWRLPIAANLPETSASLHDVTWCEPRNFQELEVPVGTR
jgi:hypothetical protein